MKRLKLYLQSILLFFVFPAAVASVAKEPAVAGSFYPADRKKLEAELDSFLEADTEPAGVGRLLALISPHAGYMYSGHVAGHSYARLRGADIRTVLLIGPCHHAAVSGAVIYPGSGLKTPLGVVPVDESLAASLASDRAGVRLAAEPFAREHSLEVQLPFLQRTLREFSVVPILVGRMTADSYRHLADAMAVVLERDEKSILVISTDLSHYHDARKAGVMDRKVLDAAERLAAGELERLFASGEGEMCGAGAVLYGLAAARGAGATEGELFRYADSGDVSGDKGYVVGYGAIGYYRRELSPGDRDEIIALARGAVECHVCGTPLPEWHGESRRLKADGAVFVTLKERGGRLRGCIGSLHATMPLYRSIIQNGVSAASRDPRFAPVRPEELPGLEVEVTVLSTLHPIAGPEEVVIGRDGLFLEAAGRSGVFLPQVPVEQGWDLQTYLQQLAVKAGLSPDGWKGGRLYRFTGEIVH